MLKSIFFEKKILLIIGGGISAYKVLEVIRELKKNGSEIKTILTKSGREFVTPLSISALSQNKVFENLFDPSNESEMDHITLARWCDVLLVAPATANLLSNFADGKASDFATTAILASNKKIFLAPAMNVEMWNKEINLQNVEKLKKNNFSFIGPTIGEMACGEYGEGKMSSVDEIIFTLKNYFISKNQKKKLSALVTAGPTREYIDPVRFLTNESSGKQGLEIAKSLSEIGFQTKLILGPNKLNLKNLSDLDIEHVKTGEEMLNACKESLPVDVAVCTAAVSDFKPKEVFKNKIKKDNLNTFELAFEKNRDILSFISQHNKNRPKLVVGFAAETENYIENAKKKLEHKHCDWIVVNNVKDSSIGFNSEFNEVFIINKNNEIEKLSKSPKSEIAKKLAHKIFEKLHNNVGNFN